MKALVRMTAILLLSAATAFGRLSPSEPQEKTLAVSVTAPDNQIAQPLDTKDLEHFFVSELKDRRITALPLTSIDDPEQIEGLYVLEVSIDQADIAQRPIWSWTDKRYRDDEILHLELSLDLTRFSDRENFGALYYAHDYRAADYGVFTSPQAIRGAVYESLSTLASNFASALEKGDFGGEVQTFQHPFTPDDALEAWTELSIEWKVAFAFAALAAFVLLLGLFFRVLYAISGLFAPPRPKVVFVHEKLPSGKRNPSTVLEACPEDEDESETLDQTV